MEDPNAVEKEQRKDKITRTSFGKNLGEARERAMEQTFKDFMDTFKFKNPEQVELVRLIIKKNMIAFSADVIDVYLTDLAQVREFFEKI